MIDETFSSTDGMDDPMNDFRRIHTFPVGKNHDVSSHRECWCSPRYERVCNECNGSGCQFCRDGFVDTELPFEAEHVIHNDVAWPEIVTDA